MTHAIEEVSSIKSKGLVQAESSETSDTFRALFDREQHARSTGSRNLSQVNLSEASPKREIWPQRPSTSLPLSVKHCMCCGGGGHISFGGG